MSGGAPHIRVGIGQGKSMEGGGEGRFKLFEAGAAVVLWPLQRGGATVEIKSKIFLIQTEQNGRL